MRPVSYAYAMPSPLNGLIAAPASPTTIHVGPVAGRTDPPVGSLPPVGGPHEVSGRMPQRDGAVATNASMRRLVFTDFHPANVDSSPTPTFTVPSPAGGWRPPSRLGPRPSRRGRAGG